MVFENKKDYVSVIVPCYNVEKYVDKCLSSILEQTYNKIHLVAVNDGSTDDTENVILSYKEKFLKKGFLFDYVYQQNSGVGFAVNKALKYVKGEFFCWIDADDWYDVNYVETVVDGFKKFPEYSLIRVNGYYVSDTDGKELLGLRNNDEVEKTEEKMFVNCLRFEHFSFAGAGGAMIRTEDFDKINPNREIFGSRGGQNYQLFLPMFYYYKTKFIDKPLQYILVRKESLSRKKGDYEFEISKLESVYEIVKNVVTTVDKSYLRHVYDSWARRLFYNSIGNNDFLRAKKYYKILKSQNLLSKKERKYYRARIKKIDFWLYLKDRLFNKTKSI